MKTAVTVNRYRSRSAEVFAARKTIFLPEFLRRQVGQNVVGLDDRARAAARLPPGVRVVIVGPHRRRLAARSHLCVVPSVCQEACSTTVLEALALTMAELVDLALALPKLLEFHAEPA